VWLATDVLLCTASIYNLLAISFDRFMAVSWTLHYKMITRHRLTMPLLVLPWLLAFTTAAFPLIQVNFLLKLFSQGLAQDEFEKTEICSPLHNSNEYILISSALSFYIPLLCILVLYTCIYHRIRQRSARVLLAFPIE